MAELTLFVEHQCNLRCTYCYNGDKFTRTMSADTMRRAIDLALERPGGHFDLSFFGGEPLLRLGLLQQATEYLDQRLRGMPAPRPTHRILVNTNGTLLNEEAVDWLSPPQVATVFVSLDGPRDLHDRHRVDSSGRGSFDRVLEGLDRLRRRHIAFQLLSVITPETARRLGETVALLVDQEPRKITLSVNYADDWTETSCADLRAGLRDAGEIYKNCFRSGKVLPLDPLHTKILTHLKGGIPCPSRCLLAGHEWTVTPSGRIYPCAQMVGRDEGGDLVIGHVDTGLDADRMALLQQSKDRVEQACADCALRDRCQSHCGCRHLRLTGQLGEITATLCETESAFIEAADDVAEMLFAEQCETFVAYYYQRSWNTTAGAQLTQLRRSRDA